MAAFFPLLFQRPLARAPGGWVSLYEESLRPAPRAANVAAPVAFRTYANERPLRVEVLAWDEARHRASDWSDLAARCLEPNVFLEPAFALAGAQHSPSARRPVFMFVSEATRGGAAERLIGVCALNGARGKFGAIARGSCSKLAALGTPLLDRVRGAEALEMMLGWFARHCPSTTGVLFPSLPASGPTARLIRARALALDLDVRAYNAHSRAILPSGGDCNANWERTIAPKRMKELRRQHRRLAETGALKWVSAREPDDIRAAFEQFLALEARGWKGERRTALLCDPALATFGRAMTRMLARGGQCRIDSLEIDGRPIAMGITIISGKSAALWKIAYDETYAAYSPGVQFTLEFTRRQLADTAIAYTDSCAIPDHPMIDKIWPERMPVVDLFISIAPDRAKAFHTAGEREALRRRAFACVKTAWHVAQRVGSGAKASLAKTSAPIAR